MGKFHTIATSLLVFGTANITFMPTANLIIQKGYIPVLPESATSSTNKDDFVYSGYLLRYFIYKSSNISNNNTVEMMEENIINNKDKIYGKLTNTKNVTKANKNLFEMSLMASIINISIYGMKTWKEFFAEAYSKWMTTPDEMKNKSWEILNEFFIEIYSLFQKQQFGSRMDSLQKRFKIIDDYITKSKIIYDTNLVTPQNDVVNLRYGSPIFGRLFGLQQEIPRHKNLWKPNYIFNSLKTGLIMWQSNGTEDVKNNILKFDGNVLRDIIINNGSRNLSVGLANMMNDSYTKASSSSLTKYENFINAAKQKYYSSFDELDSDLKTLTKYENNYYHQNGSTIFLKDSVQAMKNYYGWDNDVIRKLENQILDLFNTTYTMVDSNFKYFLIGLLFSPDVPLLDQARRIAAYTTYSFQNQAGTDQIVSTTRAYIIISAKGFDNSLRGITISEYQIGWWSSPNVFCILNHEMGHAIDVYYGMIKEARNNAKKYFKNILNVFGIKGQYRGNIFGYDNIVNYNQKVNFIKIILIVIFGIFCISIIIIIWGVSRKNLFEKKYN